jgi:arylsulfatase A-like enzyme
MRANTMAVLGWAAVLVFSGQGALAAPAKAHRQPHNVIIFIADGLRSGIVTPQTAPALAAVRDQGVDFHNSHSLYPTVTTANASAIATGHYLGDTGDYGNTLYVGPGALPPPVGTVARMEDNAVLGVLNDRYDGNYLNEESLLAAARRQGFSTAAIGKLGPIAIQDVSERSGAATIVIDDATGRPTPEGIALSESMIAAIKTAGLLPVAAARGDNGRGSDVLTPGTRVANIDQIGWFADVTTKVVLPRFRNAGRPFALVFWSRDPDGSQHNQGDSYQTVSPGINGATSMAAIRNASDTLQKLRDTLKALGLDKTTDIVVTADHGFSTVTKESRTSAAARLSYRDVRPGMLPSGFVAIDLSLALGMPLWTTEGKPLSPKDGERPAGAAALGPDPAHPLIVVAGNGGSNLIYLGGPDPGALARRIAPLLTAQDYTGALFANDDLGPVPGALPMSAINLMGSGRMLRPSIVLSFASRAGDCAQPESCQVIVTDDNYQQGQGSHGTFGRGDTHNFMAAIGPDFKTRFRDPSPVSNADLAPTLAKALGITMQTKGRLKGRVISESLKGGAAVASRSEVIRSTAGPDGFTTVLNYQEAGGRRYFDAAGMPGRTFGLKP